MRLTQTQKAIDAFREYIIKQARTNLTKGKKNNSKELYNSLKGVTKAFPNSIQVQFEMEDYGRFVDKGVSGTEKKYNTPYSYKQSSNVVGMEYHTQTFAKWAKARNFRLRSAGGKFAKGNYRTIGYILANSIKKKGIKPSLFFTKPFEKAYKNLPNELVAAYGLDLEQFLQFTLKDNEYTNKRA